MKPFSLLIFILFLCISTRAQFIKAVSLHNTPEMAMAYLKGTATFDPMSKNYISYKWYLESGQKTGVNIESGSGINTRVSGLAPGVYQFGFIVTDKRLKLADTSYMTVTVKKP